MPSKYIKLTPEERAAAYAKRDAGGVASKLAKEKRIKELKDSFIETGDYENFKTQLAPSQKKFRLPSGNLRIGTGGRVPPTILKEITEAFEAGPDSTKFKELVRISGRDASELIEFSEKIPTKGTIEAKTRAIKAKESFPESRKKTEAEKAATQAKAKFKRADNIKYSKEALGQTDFEFLEKFNKKKTDINKFFKNDFRRLFNTDFGKNTKDLIDARFKDGKIIFDRRPNSYYDKVINKGIYSEYDVSPARFKKKSLRFPINLNLAPSQFNSTFIEQVDRYFRKNKNPEALNEVSEFLKSKNLRLNIPDVGTIGAEADVAFDSKTKALPRVEKTLQILGYDGDIVEQLKNVYKNAPEDSVVRKNLDTEFFCSKGCFVKVADKNPTKIIDIINKNPNTIKALVTSGQVITADKLPRPDDAKLADTFKETNLRWNNDVGAFETTNGDIATQGDIKKYAADNPMEVKVGEEPVKAATNKSVLANVGKAMARIGAPLPTALLDSYFIGQQVKEGKGTAEIASNPLNWLGLATMEPLSKVAGIAEGGAFNKALRLGLNPATIRGISRFAGLPGLAVSTAMTAYDQYQKYKDGEGFIFNLLNQKGTE